MKGSVKIIVLLVTLLCGFVANSQTNFATLTETNWVKPGPYLRVVDGVTYNTAYSKKWGYISGFENLPNGESLGVLRVNLIKVEAVTNDEVICGIYKQTYHHETYTGALEPDEGQELLKYICVYHVPNASRLVSGVDFPSIKCMPVAPHNANGIPINAYDCGLQATNSVPVITKKNIPLTPPK
jgi:hypothetical protein